MGKQTNNLYEEVTIAGFGGQGIILVGKLLAQAAMKAGKEVTFMPSYGAEVRGGASNCMVVISDQPIPSPVVSNPQCVIAMSKAALSKFEKTVKKGGTLIINSSQIDVQPKVDDSVEVVKIPIDEIAVGLGNAKVANMVALGAYLQKRGLFSPDEAAESLPDVLAERYHVIIPLNKKAIQKGAEFVKDSGK
jgi:2-oxoglutarate ferredoxin oxidoreductase subunit gamma